MREAYGFSALVGAIAALLVVFFDQSPSARVASLRAVAVGLATGYVTLMLVQWYRLDA